MSRVRFPSPSKASSNFFENAQTLRTKIRLFPWMKIWNILYRHSLEPYKWYKIIKFMVGDFGWEHEGPSSRIGTVNLKKQKKGLCGEYHVLSVTNTYEWKEWFELNFPQYKNSLWQQSPNLARLRRLTNLLYFSLAYVSWFCTNTFTVSGMTATVQVIYKAWIIVELGLKVLNNSRPRIFQGFDLVVFIPHNS